jgi:hypothetical protein
MSSPIFTRRHYVAIAGLLRDAGCLSLESRAQLIQGFSELFSADNGRFQPDRFRTAAYNGVKVRSER